MTTNMRVETLNEAQTLHVEQALSLGQEVSGAYSVDYDQPARLMFVQPVNGQPYIVKLPNTLYRFTYEPENSGTAKLRARIDARIFYENLKNGH